MSAMSSRERILGRLRASAQPAAVDATAAALARLDCRIDEHFDAQRGDANQPAAMARSMEEALAAARVEVMRATSHEWPALLAARLAEHGVRRLLLDTSGAEGAVLAQALPAEILAQPFERPIEEWKQELFDGIDAGFTVARSGIAATGTLVLAPDAGSPRTMSLVPPLHIALVYASTLHPDLHTAARAERWGDGMPSNLVLVTGPSKTSDIQQTLAYGAHGPRWLWCVIVMDLEVQP